MAATIPTCEPDALTAGTTWRWDITLPDHPPSDGWTLAYYLRGAGTLDITEATGRIAVVDGHFEIRVPAADTADLAPGGYHWVAIATSGEEADVVREGALVVLANPITLADGQTHNERTLAAIEAKIEGRLTTDQETVQINGRGINKIPFEKLLELRGLYTYLVLQERNPGMKAASHQVVFRAVD